MVMKIPGDNPGQFCKEGLYPCPFSAHSFLKQFNWKAEGKPREEDSQENTVLKGDVREGPVHQDHLCVLDLFPKLQQQEHGPAVQVWGQRVELAKAHPPASSL